MTRPWNIAATEVQLASWREALVEHNGNISHAATAIGISRAHATRLMKKYALMEFAAELRRGAGMAEKGRPRK